MTIRTFIVLLIIILADRVAPEYLHSEQISAKQLQSEINTEFIMLIEQWKPIKGYEDFYEISNYGRVKSLPRVIPIKRGNSIYNQYSVGKFLNTDKSRDYLSVVLCKNNIAKRFWIHHLVWDNFGDTPRNNKGLYIDHINQNKWDNRIVNLQLLSPRENIAKGWGIKRTLPTGVYLDNKCRVKKYRVKTQYKYQPIELGYYKTLEEAQSAYANFWTGKL